MKLESSASIARPVGEVFAYVSDMRNDPEWHTDMLEVSAPEGSVGAGTVFNIKFKPFMGQSSGTMTVAEFEPGRQVVLEGQMGKFRPTITYVFEPSGSGVTFTRRVEMDPPGIMRVMAPMMKGMMRKRNAGFVGNLKRVLESR